MLLCYFGRDDDVPVVVFVCDYYSTTTTTTTIAAVILRGREQSAQAACVGLVLKLVLQSTSFPLAT